jgi:thiol-disulfide isomerase/thioredoxin
MEKMKQSMVNRFILLALATMLALLVTSCGNHSPQGEGLTTVEALKTAIASDVSGSYNASLTSYWYATEERDTMAAYVQWIPQHGDSGWAAVGYHTVEEEGERRLAQLAVDSVRVMVSDSTYKRSTADHERVLFWWPGKFHPHFVGDSGWYASVWEGNAEVTWAIDKEHWTADVVALPDTTDPDRLPGDRLSYKVSLDRHSGRVTSYLFDYYVESLAYGYTFDVRFDWTDETAEEVESALLNWTPAEGLVEELPEDSQASEEGADNEDENGEQNELTDEEKWEIRKQELTAGQPQIGDQAPAIVGVDINGEPSKLSDFRGDLVFLDYWYIGCGPCMRALPHLQELNETYAEQGFRVLGMNANQTADVVTGYFKRRNLQLEQLILDSLPAAYPIRVAPTWFLIGRDGAILDTGMGFGDDSPAQLDSMIQVHI